MRTEDNEEPVVESTPARRPGEELARAREQAGIGLRAMADTLHLPENQLRALEGDDYDSLPPPTFVRGYLRSYARVLGLDDDDIVAAYDAMGSTVEDPRLHLSGGREASEHRRGLVLSLTALALVVAVSLGAWWWQSSATGSAGPLASAADAGETETSDEETANAEPSGSRSEGDTGEQVVAANASPDMSNDSTTETETPQLAVADDDAFSPERAQEPRAELAAAPDDTSPADSGARTYGVADAADANAGGESGESDRGSNEPSAEQETSPEEAEASEVAESTDRGAESDEAATEVASYDPPAATASAEAATAPQAAEGPEALRVQVDGRTWIEVNDARGRELVYTLYSGSAPLELRGWPPFDVFLGNSPAVSLEFNGEAVDKSAFTRSNNTARFVVDGDGVRRR